MKKNSVFAWFLATRPKTLVAGIVPVLIGTGLAYRNGCFQAMPAIFCLLFAVFAQITANLVNDYFDFKNGFDKMENRLGPTRALTAGWIDPSKMKIGFSLTFALSCLFGLGLIPYGGMEMIYVGIFALIFCILYSGGPFPLSALALGDLLVLIFFGIVAVCFTYFVQAAKFSWELIPLSLSVGLAIDNILVSNNYRDREVDRQAHKLTTISIFGERFGRFFYLINGLLVCAFLIYYFSVDNAFQAWTFFLPLIYFLFHIRAWILLNRIRQGKQLNRILELSAKNVMILALLCLIGLIWG
ncbi:MAG: 1,4-dihydroxy-2-naphthoate octaprenyltransferase [Planctomycetia bacterium]|nr:1,4-dihydroxy-2-naphthoate octaprenyltransferase [Planctomycetia bacterium]